MIFLNSNEKYGKGTSLALGIFDGVHLGHRAILTMAKGCAKQDGAFGVFTFRTSSVRKKHGVPYEYIYTDSQKERLLEEMGAEVLYSPEICELMDMTGEEFARKILKDKLCAETVVCGEKFRFGKGAQCGVSELKAYGEKYGFEVKLCPTVYENGEKISSGRIKEYLRDGDISAANRLLGRNYFISAEVVEGNRLGRTIDFPTANQLFLQRQTVLKRGCYVTSVDIDGREYKAVTNVGVKPTVEKNISPLAETHILGFEGDIYGRVVDTAFSAFIRPERKFPSLEALKEQIRRDIQFT